jgi:peptidyl-dipeptidase Dcp
VISTDAYEAFTEGDGPYDKEVAKRLYESVLAWEILQIKKMLTEVLGDVKSDALMRARGFDSFKAENKK